MIPLIAVSAVMLAGAEGLTAGPVELVSEGYGFTEGPVWMPGEGILFSDIPANTIYRGDKTVYRKPSGHSNGLALDRQGRLITCEHGNRRVARTEKDGSTSVLAETYQGKKLNSPNDLVIRSDGAIFFTDPPYGVSPQQAELGFSGVYLIDPKGGLTLLFDEFEKPNGLALSPDEKTLYLGDSGAGIIHVFNVAANGTLSKGRLFAKCPGADGMKMDEKGRLWTTAEDGVRVYAPDGSLLDTVAFPRKPANCGFGGEDGTILFVTAREGLYKVATKTKP